MILRGKSAEVDIHLRPQTLVRTPGDWVSWAGTIDKFAVAINGLQNYSLHKINAQPTHDHATNRHKF